MRSCHTSEMTCASTVAIAAPRMPQPKPKMNSGSRIVLMTTVLIVAYIDLRGCPEARSTEFRPRYMCVTTLPSRMTVMYSRA